MGVQVSPQRNGLFPDVLLCNGFPNIIHSFLPLKTCQHGDFDQHHLCGKQDQEKLSEPFQPAVIAYITQPANDHNTAGWP